MPGHQAAIEDAVARGALRRFPREHVKSWLGSSVRLELPPGSFIYHEHEEPRAGLVVDGLLRMFMTGPDGREVTVRYARTGQLIGIPAVVGGPAPVHAQVLTESVLLMMPVEALRDAGKSDARVAWLFAEEACRRLYDSLEGLAGNAFGSLGERVCRHLLELAAEARREDRLRAGVTQQELADAVGSSRVAVARILNGLREAGFIETGSGVIELLDPSAIHERAWARE